MKPYLSYIMKNVIKKFNQNINKLIDKNVNNINKNNNNYQRLIANRFETNSTTDSLLRRQSSIDRRRAPSAPSTQSTTTGLKSKEKMASDLSLAPIRSLDDFLLSLNRFHLPQFKDLEKWNKRVVYNLHYYQTNYFVTAIMIFTLIGYLLTTSSALLQMLLFLKKFFLFQNFDPIFGLILILIWTHFMWFYANI